MNRLTRQLLIFTVTLSLTFGPLAVLHAQQAQTHSLYLPTVNNASDVNSTTQPPATTTPVSASTPSPEGISEQFPTAPWLYAPAELTAPMCAPSAKPGGEAVQLPASNAGYTAGDFSVSESGAANYMLPIFTPPGTSGMTPDLSLVFNSQGGNGLLGVGWSLSGLSAIARCPSTLVRNGYVGGINLEASDQLCLDGQVLVPETPGGSTYRTEIDGFARITAAGTLGSGPASFQVATKSGLTMEYGTTADARLVLSGTETPLSWSINRVTDSSGNYFTVEYATGDQEQLPTRIRYTGNDAAGVAPYNAIDFVYEERPDTTQQYVAGAPVQSTQRLRQITVSVDGAAVREYRLQYRIGALANRSLLTDVTECAGDGTCLRPTRFEWAESGLGFLSEPWETEIPHHMYRGGGEPKDYQTLSGDFNGDGKTDLAAIGRALSEESGWRNNIYMSLSTGTGFIDAPWETALPQHMWGGLGETSDYYIIPGDYNGDGLTDLAGVSRALVEGSGWQQNIYVALSTGSGFVTHDWSASLPQHLWNGGGTIQDYQILPGDFNGDGLTDLAAAGRAVLDGSGWQQYIYVELSTGQGFTSLRWDGAIPQHMTNGGGETSDYRLLPGDFNGDGLTDIAGVSRASSAESGWRQNVYIELSTGDAFRSLAWAAGIPQHMYNGGGETINYQVIPADFNSDGKTDLAAVGRASDDNPNNGWRQHIYVDLSSGTGFLPRGWTAELPRHMYNGNENTTDFRVVAGDFNSDGRTDLGAIGLVTDLNNGFSQNIYVELGTDDGFIPKTWPAVTPQHMRNGGGESLAYQTVMGNFDGRGGTDIATVTRPTTEGSGWIDWASMELAQTHHPDLLTGITNGHGATIDIHYLPMTDDSVYSRGGTGEYPQMVVQMPTMVVAEYYQSNGIGGRAGVNYAYSGMRIDTQGRGSLGFREIAAADRQTGITTRTTYHQSFPHTGLVQTSEQRLADGTLISHSENVVANLETIAGRAYFPYVQQSKTTQYEIDGQLVNETTTTSAYDNFGNATKVTVAHSDGWSQETVNTYTNDTNRWFLGRLTRAQVTAQSPTGSPQTRASGFAYDANTGLLVEETVEPDTPQLSLAKSYAHDAFGNIIRSTVAGADIATRSQESEYDARGQFVVRSTNALGHSETRQIDARFGSPTAVTGPNGLTTRSEYDAFGRSVKSTSPTGIESATSHRLCESGACPPNAVYSVQTKQAGSPAVTEYFDELDRAIRQEREGFGDRIIVVETQYDEHGWVIQSSEPYYAGESIYWNQYTHDVLGRVVQQTLPDGSTISTGYSGFTTTVQNALGRTTTRTVDSQGQLVQSVDSAGNRISYQYDSFGNLTTMTDPAGNETRMSYDLRGRKLTLVDPDAGGTSYTYNVLDELVAQEDANGNRAQFQYDVLGRMIQRTEPEGTTTWLYDAADKGIGKLARVTGPDGYAEAFVYDAYGRPTQTTYTIADESYTSCTSYDPYSRVATITWPTGFAVAHEYDDTGYLRSVRNAADNSGDNSLYWQATAINARGQLQGESLGNGLTTTRSYDPELGLLQSIGTGRSGDSAVQNLRYDFDVLGNLTARHDDNQGLSESFGYDQLDRLTSWQVSGQAAKSAEYDALGNIIQRSDVGSYSYGANGAGPHAVTAIEGGPHANSYRYDANGNRITSQGGSVEYTSFNKPSRIAQGNNEISFVYGPGRSHYQKTVNDAGSITTTYYVGGAFEIDVTGTDTRFRHYIGGGNGVVATHTTGSDGTSTTRYLHRDHIGSIDTITDASGNVVERLSYDAWGKRRLPTWQDTDDILRSELPRGFTGHEQLDAVGLIHMGGRVYDPLIGRFLSADPFVQAPDSTQSLNRYSYVLNNPLSYTDPSGFIAKALGRAFKSVVDFIKDNWKEIVVAAVTIAAAYVGTAIWGSALFGAQSFGAAVLGGVTSGFTGGFSGTLINGGSLSSALKAGFRGAADGALSAGLFYGVGSAAAKWSHPARVAAHGVAGGVSRVVQGGKFEHGFVSAAATQLFAPEIEMLDDTPGISVTRTVAASVVGGTASVLGGGRFANGAITGAFSRMFNDDMHRRTFWSKLKGEHGYMVMNEICAVSSGQHGCTAQEVYKMMVSNIRYQAPALPSLTRKSVGEGWSIHGLPIGFIIANRNDAALTVTNYTTPLHLLHEGVVSRQVVEMTDLINEVRHVYVISTGTGSGILPGVNDSLAPVVWGAVDYQLRNAMND